MLQITGGGSRIGFYFILALLVLLLTAKILSGLREFVKNRKQPVMKDTAVVLDREALPGGLVMKLTFATLSHGALALEMTEREAKLFKEGSRGILTWQGGDFRSFVPERRGGR
ncbi:MAG: hypothetical protein ACSW8K_05845 [bacterium]